jgi:hypothetical protein
MASSYSITLVVGYGGFPGHAAIQINRPDYTTYAGMGPADSRSADRHFEASQGAGFLLFRWTVGAANG